MNQIKTKDRYNNMKIRFELYALEIYIKNDGMEPFDWLIK